MFDWRNFPWTDFQDLNLDWVVRRLKIYQDAIEANKDKIGDTYNYISENLDNIVEDKLPAIVSSLQSVIINVKWYGATGDGTTDDSAAILEALTHGNILYFPAGTYRFKEVTTGKPVVIFGDGDETIFTPIHRHAGTNQGYTMFNFQDSVHLSSVQLRFDTSVTTQTGEQFYQAAAFKAVGVQHVHLENVLFDNIFDTHHLSVAPLTFENREGLAVYFNNCDFVCIKDCEVKEFGGEELMWISRSAAQYGNGRVLITGNYYHDRTSQLTGSALNVLGGTLLFTGNLCHNFNNLYLDRVEKAGSLFNLLGAFVNCSDNLFINCYCGNYMDFSEGYYTKTEELICSNNIFSGKAAGAIRFMAKKATFTGNYIDSVLCLNALTIDALPPTGLPYCADASTLYDFDLLKITGNHFHFGAMPYDGAYPSVSYSVGVSVGQHPGSQVPVYGKIEISDNQFTRDSANTTHDVIWQACESYYTTINNNIFEAGSAGAVNSVSGANLNFVGGGAGGYPEGVVNQVNIIGNTFVCDQARTYTIIGGDSSFRARTAHILSNNTAVIPPDVAATVNDHLGSSASWGRAQNNNNYQITDVA